MLPFSRIAIIGLGLIGSSVARGVRATMRDAVLSGFDADPAVRDIVRALELVDHVADSAGDAVRQADLVVLCVDQHAKVVAELEDYTNQAGAGSRTTEWQPGDPDLDPRELSDRAAQQSAQDEADLRKVLEDQEP